MVIAIDRIAKALAGLVTWFLQTLIFLVLCPAWCAARGEVAAEVESEAVLCPDSVVTAALADPASWGPCHVASLTACLWGPSQPLWGTKPTRCCGGRGRERGQGKEGRNSDADGPIGRREGSTGGEAGSKRSLASQGRFRRLEKIVGGIHVSVRRAPRVRDRKDPGACGGRGGHGYRRPGEQERGLHGGRRETAY